MYTSTTELALHLTLSKARKLVLEDIDTTQVRKEIQLAQEQEQESINLQHTMLGTKLSKSTLQSLNNRQASLDKHKVSSDASDATLSAYNRERLGQMFLDQIDSMLRMPSFSGYSDNWSDEFKSQAILNLTSYAHNFCVTKISPRTSKPVKAFAYTTQIIFNSFISVINREKANSDFIKNQIDESNKAFGAFTTSSCTENVQQTGVTIYGFNTHEVDQVTQVIEHNQLLQDVETYTDEIERLLKNVPTSKRTSDFKLYVADLEEKAQEFKNKINPEYPYKFIGKILLDDATYDVIKLGSDNNIVVENVPTNWTD